MQKTIKNRLLRWDFCIPESFFHGLRSKCSDLIELYTGFLYNMEEYILSNEFQKLTIKDSFMFAAVMSDEEQCRRLLEISLDMEILSVRVITEKTFSYHPDYHGVRLDVFAVENGTQRHFN